MDPSRARHLPGRRVIVTLAAVSALSAIAGGIGLIGHRTGGLAPLSLLAHTPFVDFLVPGLVLLLVVGGSSLACAVLAARRSRAAIEATVLAGGTLSVWIFAEAAMMRMIHWLHVVHGALGLALLALGLSAAWRSRSRRRRWLIAVTLAETLGYLAPACTGILATRYGLAFGPTTALVIAAGLLEGFLLGAAQAWALPFRVRSLRYAAYTASSAALVWLAALLVVRAIASGAGNAFLLAAVAAPIGLAAIGTAQWLELRHHARAAWRWVAWTALAWVVALPFSFAPGPFVDESTPGAVHLVLWACGGLLMAFAMALVTWQGVRALSASDAAIKPFAAATP